MTTPLINILIRASRPDTIGRCLDSIREQTYKHTRVIVYEDGINVDDDIVHTTVTANHDRSQPFFFNLFINDLMAYVQDGFMLVLDDDDRINAPDSLAAIVPNLSVDRPVICQMLRDDFPKPGNVYMDKRIVSKGRIGMPCLLLHARHKDIYQFEAVEDADYRWIKIISEVFNCKFVKQVVVDAGGRPKGGNSL